MSGFVRILEEPVNKYCASSFENNSKTVKYRLFVIFNSKCFLLYLLVSEESHKIPVCTLSPTCNSDIAFVLPSLNLAVDGKHPTDL